MRQILKKLRVLILYAQLIIVHFFRTFKTKSYNIACCFSTILQYLFIIIISIPCYFYIGKVFSYILQYVPAPYIYKK